MHVVLRDGYEANLTAQWHKIREISATALFPGCRELYGKGAKNDVIRASIVVISATFPQVNGFSWPDNKGLKIGGSTNGGTSCVDSTADPTEQFLHSDLSPGHSSIQIMYAQDTEKTPANPSGVPKTDTLTKANFTIDDTYGTCTGTGLEKVAIPFCRMQYSE